ncbi:MAG TPA: TolC family protein [Opitutaceae bacterium]|nr:TolC family protein [Opitutaceae bacterium]
MPPRFHSSLAAASLLAGLVLPARAQDTPPPAGGVSAAPTSAVTTPLAPATAPASASGGAVLTVEDCVRRALEHGFDLEIQRYTRSIAQDAVDIARSGFTPTLSLTGSESHASMGPVGSTPGTKTDARLANLGITELLQTGTSVSFSTNLNRSENDPAALSALTSFYNPAYTSDLTVSVLQPLLRGAGTAVTTATLNRARIGQQRAGFDFKAKALDIVQQTEGAYYNVVYAREQLGVYQVSLDLANRLLEEAQAKKTVGTATDIDVLQAQVGVASARSNVLTAEKSVKDATDALLALIGRFELDTPVGTTKLEDFNGQLPVIASSYELAIRNQPDYISAKMQLDQFKLDLAVAKDALKPTVNLNGALGFNGTKGSGSDAFSSAAGRDNNTWQVGFTVSYPWGRIGDKARYHQSLATLNQQTLTVSQLEQGILVQVRSAVRAVATNSEKVKIAALGAEFSAKQYDLELARFAAGLATSREVLQTQADLENARVAELQARVTLQNSISALRRLEGSALERYHIVLPE